MNPQPPAYTLSDDGPDALALAISGDWVQGQHPASVSALRSALAGHHPTRLITDGSALGAWDSMLPAFLLQCHDHCREQGIAFATRNMPQGIEKLLAVATAVKAQPRSAGDTPSAWSALNLRHLLRNVWAESRSPWPLPAK